VADVKTPMKLIFEELCKPRMMQSLIKSNERKACEIHPKGKHSIEECEEFKQLLQGLLDMQLIQIRCPNKNNEVNAIKEPTSF